MAGWEAGCLWLWSGLQPGFGRLADRPSCWLSFSFVLLQLLAMFSELLLGIFSFILRLLLLIFSTPLWIVLKVVPEYAKSLRMK